MDSPQMSTSDYNASRASVEDKEILEIWRKGAKAESRLNLLENLQGDGKALKEAVRLGKVVQSQKQVQGEGDCDWDVVSCIMQKKLEDARLEVRRLKDKKRTLKAKMKAQGPLLSARKTLARAQKEARTIFDKKKEKIIGLLIEYNLTSYLASLL